MSIEIRVSGMPPKKRTDTSLWNNGPEVPRVIALRRAARAAFGGRGPFKSHIRLRLSIFLNSTDFFSSQVGDLDNFISGVCDALQAASPQAGIHEQFSFAENEDIAPSIAIAIENDVAVVSIVADKFLANEQDQAHYNIIIEGD